MTGRPVSGVLVGLALVAAAWAGDLTHAASPGGVATTTFARGPGWTTARLIASPHATQAAAADAHHAYAISNTTVAQYDRRTGRLVATGTAADATHLNSGFVHDGRVYCAHSNYPAEPPESDIRVFDPATGRLEVFHRFHDPPGSLVWCVRRGGRWWCCFASYGAANGRTVLVEYADGGLDREVRRFTFPPAVVADWDGMSASGGIWDGDTLLVSHHHFPVLYRLSLPAAGAELDFVEALACPFPGQGIAADPATGGLVGIDRVHRRLVFAERE
ncbi:MAG: endonuclease [Planctomycetota bacterium]